MTRGTLTRVLLAAIGVSYSVVAVVAVSDRSGVLTTYAAGSAAAAAAFLTAGFGLTAAGLLAAADRATGSLWVLCVLAGMAWLSPALVGWETGPALARSIGMVLAPFLLPVLVHLLLAVPAGRMNGRLRRRLVAGVYGITAAASVGLAVTRDPFLDPDCWSNCTDNVFLLVGDSTSARAIGTVWLCAVVALGALALLAGIWQLVTATAVARAVGWTIIVPAGLAAGAEAVYAAVLLADPAENPERSPFAGIFLARAASLTALAVGVGWFVGQRRRRRAAFVRLVNDLEASPGMGSLQATLSRSWGDPSLSLAYWLPSGGRYVDPYGRQAHPHVEPDRAQTYIVRGGAQVAVISHERAILDDESLRQRIGPATLLAIDNERLGVELLAHLEDLRASRSRIVAAADDARRRIERDLHDGAQQRLLAVLYELRLARRDSDDDERSAALDAMIEGTQKSLAELRELAQGIFPAILDESGLGPALSTLADRAAVAVEVGTVPEERLPAPVERTAYLVVAETLAAQPDGGSLSVHVDLHDDTLVVELDGVDVGPTEHLTDRVGAAGGVLAFDAGTVRAEIPCA